MSALSLLFLGFLGLCVGSFVNVLVLRFGFDERASTRSRCMACDAPIAWYDLLPVISFFALRARCRRCGSSLSFQYPIVEAGMAALFVLTGMCVPPVLSVWSLVAFGALLFFVAALAALVAYDIRHTLVPLPFVYALLLSAAVASLSQCLYTQSFGPLLDSVSGGAALFLFFMAIVLVTRGKGMGAGDAYVAAAIGILLGLVRGIEAVMVGVWAGAIVGLLMLFFRKQVTMKTELPLIPFLAFGVAIALYTDFSPLMFAAGISNALFSGRL